MTLTRSHIQLLLTNSKQTSSNSLITFKQLRLKLRSPDSNYHTIVYIIYLSLYRWDKVTKLLDYQEGEIITAQAHNTRH